MDDKEFKAQMERIYAYNRKQKAERQEMVRLRLNEQTIREALSSITSRPKLAELAEAVKKIKKALDI